MSNTIVMADLSTCARDFAFSSSWQQVQGSPSDAHAYVGHGVSKSAGYAATSAATALQMTPTADAKAARIRNANVAKPARPPRGAPR